MPRHTSALRTAATVKDARRDRTLQKQVRAQRIARKLSLKPSRPTAR